MKVPLDNTASCLKIYELKLISVCHGILTNVMRAPKCKMGLYIYSLDIKEQVIPTSLSSIKTSNECWQSLQEESLSIHQFDVGMCRVV